MQMGFRPEVFSTLLSRVALRMARPYALRVASQVDHFQPYYTFNKKHMTELRIGAAILREAMETADKEEDEGLKVRTAKAEEELRKKRVCVLFSPSIFQSSGKFIFLF